MDMIIDIVVFACGFLAFALIVNGVRSKANRIIFLLELNTVQNQCIMNILDKEDVNKKEKETK